jgi:hypothetical protein
MLGDAGANQWQLDPTHQSLRQQHLSPYLVSYTLGINQYALSPVKDL